jgi:hypothetical protein
MPSATAREFQKVAASLASTKPDKQAAMNAGIIPTVAQ